MTKFLVVLLLLFATPALAQQVPAPINAPASVTSGHALCATANRQQAADCGAALGSLATLAGSTQGQIVYWNGSSWALLSPGTSGQHLATQGSGANPVWATPPLGPGYVSGPYYLSPVSAVTAVALSAANTVMAIPFYATAPQTFTKISIDVASSPASTIHCELGVYANSGGVPGALLVDAGEITITTSTTGIQEITGQTVALSQGWYWLAVGCDGQPTLEEISSSSLLTGLYMGWSSFTAIESAYTVSWTFSTGNLPNPFGAPTLRISAGWAPMVGLRF
jgi:hypothetical protein